MWSGLIESAGYYGAVHAIVCQPGKMWARIPWETELELKRSLQSTCWQLGQLAVTEKHVCCSLVQLFCINVKMIVKRRDACSQLVPLHQASVLNFSSHLICVSRYHHCKCGKAPGVCNRVPSSLVCTVCILLAVSILQTFYRKLWKKFSQSTRLMWHGAMTEPDFKK